MDSPEQEITITPDPQILQVLTYLEMRPIDSLCELIDNSIDALSEQPLDAGTVIMVDLPSKKEVDDGSGRVRVRDNGPGMTLEQVENSLKAGYSSKQRYGSLGLFGVGFNIASGKIGCQTRLLTARKDDDYAIQVILDLMILKRSGNFKVKATKIEKPEGFQHGTMVEITKPWTAGNQNFGFMMKLISIGRSKILTQLGRIYATILREKKVRIVVGEDSVASYSHCVWDESRYVEHLKHGRIPAVYRFQHKVIHTYRKCASCGATIHEGETCCPDSSCGSSSLVTHEERISGWVGIQRYLDASHFGIDLIRNGRAIRTLEKEAFFQFQDPETGDPIVDYPIDNREGRIVGEIHLDHVPVDPAKQNFERSSPEWRRAIEFLRGKSSLQPERPGADSNMSPIFKLYQGYRKVRNPGRRSMTMGKWLPGNNEPKALSRAEIDDLKQKFDNRDPGYFDDAEWWKLVEQAEEKPVEGLRACPSCHLDSPSGLEECPHCAHIFEGKLCLNNDCGKTISRSAVLCPICGANQVPEVVAPWNCGVCGRPNSSDETVCEACGNTRGTLNPVSKDGLNGISHKDDELSIRGLSIGLASGNLSSPIDVTTYLTDGHIYSYRNDGTKIRLPSVTFTINDIEIYIDPSHPLFVQAGVQPEQQVASEAAAYLHVYYKGQSARNQAEHTITKITYDVLRECWPGKFSTSGLDAELESLFSAIRLKLADSIGKESLDIYSNLPQEVKTALASESVKRGRDISELSQLIENGQFIHFLRPKGLLEIFRINPRLFFDKHVWDITYAAIPEMYPDGGERLQSQIKNEYLGLLDISIMWSEKGIDDPRKSALVKAVCALLTAKIAD